MWSVMIRYEQFRKLMNNYSSQWKEIDHLSDMGIDILNSKFYMNYNDLFILTLENLIKRKDDIELVFDYFRNIDSSVTYDNIEYNCSTIRGLYYYLVDSKGFYL